MKRYKIVKEFTLGDYKALILNIFGHYNGYIGIPKNHPFFGKTYSEYQIYSLDVHGGVTYSESNIADKEIPDTWWIGFDTAHYGDASNYDLYKELAETPEDIKKIEKIKQINDEFQKDATFKDLQFVINEIHKLSNQLREKE